MLNGFGLRELVSEEDIEWKRYIVSLCEKNIWLTKTKQEMLISDMSDLHLKNSISTIKNGAKIRGLAGYYLPKLEEELEKREKNE